MTKAGAAARPWQGKGHPGGKTEGGCGAPSRTRRLRPDAAPRKAEPGRRAGPAPSLRCRGVAAKKPGASRLHSGFAGSRTPAVGRCPPRARRRLLQPSGFLTLAPGEATTAAAKVLGLVGRLQADGRRRRLSRARERERSGHGGREITLPRQRRQLVLLAEGQAGAAVAVGARRRLEPRTEAGRLGEGGGVPGRAQAELDSRAARLAHPPGSLQGAAAAVACVELHVKGALLLLLPHEEGRALMPAAGGTSPAGLQDVCDPSQPALFGGSECR